MNQNKDNKEQSETYDENKNETLNNNLNTKSKKTIKKKESNKKEAYWKWTVKIFFLAFALSMFFGILSELFMSGTGIILAILMVLIFISIAVITDMIGVAVLACDESPFKSMSARKVKGGKEGLFLIKNSAKIASLCADVVGDVCGVLSGAGGASVLAYLVNNNTPTALSIIIASLVSAVIAGLTIGGKAMFKQYATNNATKVVLFMGKILSIFSRKKYNKNQKSKRKKYDLDNEKNNFECKKNNSIKDQEIKQDKNLNYEEKKEIKININENNNE